MTRRSMLGLVAGACALGAALLYSSRDPEPAATAAREVIDEYCIGCHNPLDYAGNLRLDDKRLTDVAADAESWEHVVRKLKTGMMPPAGEPRPPRSVTDTLTAELETRLDRAAEARPPPARTTLRRLNSTEYANAIRDLLHLDIDAARLLPPDDSSEGFDNIATALGVSPSLIEAYVSAAMKISRRALGDRTAPRTQVTHTVPQSLAQDRHIRGLPLGTRGGLRVEHTFPLDAEYAFRVRTGFRFPRSSRVDVTLDGQPVEVDDPTEFRIPVPAGPHTLTAAIVDTKRLAGVDDVYGVYAKPGAIESVEIDGPLAPTGVGDTPSRRRILTCEPQRRADELACAEEIIATLARRAFRRPLTEQDVAALLDFFETGRAAGGFEAGLQQALARVLVDPRFLYRIEPDPPDLEPGSVYAVGDFELASRLSFFLWSSIPDDELLEVAASGRLRDAETLEAQTLRMLGDPKAEALVENFASQWLFLRELDSIRPDAPSFDENLRRAMVRETKLLFETVMREDLSVLRLLDADFTFLNERLAEHYGIAGVRGSHFRRVEIPPDNPRRGVLGHASLLTVTSVTNRTSPVIRGSWILDNLLGSPAPVPPPDVETTLEDNDGPAATASVRERLEAHRSDPNCAACHEIMDPVGFTLENFDLVGAWRETDGGRPIDTRAVLTDGTVVDGPASLRAALLDRSDAYLTTIAEKLLTYALGRRVEYYDMPTVRAVVDAAREEDLRFSALVLGIVRSEPFRMQTKGADE